MEPAQEPVTVYIFHSMIEEASPDWFKILQLQGKFWAPNNFQPGDPIKIDIEREPLVHPDHNSQSS